MKEFKLVSWPELPSEFQRTAHRRALSNLSQRFMSAQRLATCSGLAKAEVRGLLDELQHRGALVERERALSESVLSSLEPVRGWLRRQFDGP